MSGPSLEGRTAIVTGASRRAGIGFAIVERLCELGAAVLAAGWTPHDAAQPWGPDPDIGPAYRDVAEQLGGRIAYVERDLADPDAPAALVRDAADRFGHVDILVANHARSGLGRLSEITAESIDAFLRENVRATLMLVKEFAGRHDGRPGGRVVIMTSGQHLVGMPREVGYAVSKGAEQQATATLAAELMPRGITVNCVNPGPTDTGWGLRDRNPAGAMPLGRWGEASDAARLVAWLCTSEAGWITGQTVNSDGGFRP
jgi:3-oxoacyl-[acyl-carrier protein] reductase